MLNQRIHTNCFVNYLDLKIINKELAEYINSPSWDRPAFYDDDDEYSIQYKEYLDNPSNAIAPNLPTEEPNNSLSMGDEYLSTISETESDKVIKSSVEDLVLIPSESEVTFNNERDIYFLEELLINDTLSLLKNESSNFDHHDDPSFPRPPPEPPNVEVFFDFDPDMGVLTAKMVEDISEHYVLMPKVLPSQPTLCPNIDTLLSFSFVNEDKVFKPDLEDSRARGFVHRPLELQSLAYGNLIS
nr:hypothetical protein [Tanacetum cinerariifolium]